MRNFFRKKSETNVTEEQNDNQPDVVDITPEGAETEEPQAAQAEPDNSAARREADLTNKLLRLQADFDNFRKRSLAGRAEAREEARRELLLDLLPVYDNFLRAMDHAKEMEDYGSLRTGLDGILQQMREFFNRHNCREVNSLPGAAFDPNLHEAVGMVPGDGENQNTVAQEVQKGFELNGTVIRPARVLVYGGE